MPRGNLANMAHTKEEAKRRGRNGGIKSGEVRRQRRTLREELLAMLSAGDTQSKLVAALIDEATNGNKAGSVSKAFETIRDTVGEKPVEKIVVAEVDQAIIDEVEQMVKDDQT